MNEQSNSPIQIKFNGPVSAVGTDDDIGIKKPRVWTVFLTLLIAFLCTIVATIIVVLVLTMPQIVDGADAQKISEQLPRQLMTPPAFVGILVLSQLALGSVVLVAATVSPDPVRQRLGLRSARIKPPSYPVIMVGSLFPLAVGIGAAHLIAKLIPTDESALMLYEQMTNAWAIPTIILIGVLPGLMEELTFRGYVQQRFIGRWGPTVGIVVSSVIFGIFHVTPHAAAMATIIGFWLGFVAWKTNSVWPTVFCHAFVNIAWNIWQVGQRLWGIPDNPSVVVKFCLGLAIAICFLISLRIVWRAGNVGTLADSQ